MAKAKSCDYSFLLAVVLITAYCLFQYRFNRMQVRMGGFVPIPLQSIFELCMNMLFNIREWAKEMVSFQEL